MNDSLFFFSRNGYEVRKIKVLGTTYYIVTGKGKRYIRKSLKSVNDIVDEP